MSRDRDTVTSALSDCTAAAAYSAGVRDSAARLTEILEWHLPAMPPAACADVLAELETLCEEAARAGLQRYPPQPSPTGQDPGRTTALIRAVADTAAALASGTTDPIPIFGGWVWNDDTGQVRYAVTAEAAGDSAPLPTAITRCWALADAVPDDARPARPQGLSEAMRRTFDVVLAQPGEFVAAAIVAQLHELHPCRCKGSGRPIAPDRGIPGWRNGERARCCSTCHGSGSRRDIYHSAVNAHLRRFEAIGVIACVNRASAGRGRDPYRFRVLSTAEADALLERTYPQDTAG